MWTYKLIDLQRNIEIIKIATCFYMEYDKDFCFPGEVHDFWELVYCDHGRLQITGGERKFILSKGMLAFHRPMEYHDIAAADNKPANVFVLSFDTKNIDIECLATKVITLDDSERRLLSSLIYESTSTWSIVKEGNRIFLREREDMPFGGPQVVTSLFEILLISLIRKERQGPEATPAPVSKVNILNLHSDIVNRTISYFMDNVFGVVSLDELCNVMNVSKSYLEYVFHKETGKSPMAYFGMLKMEKAKELLRSGGMNITQVSEMLGFTTVHYFSRRFKFFIGMSPSEYLTSVKAMQQS